MADAMHDGKSENETWTDHVEMLEDSFRDVEDSGCTLSEESKVGVLMETFQCEPHRQLSATVASKDELRTELEAAASFIQEEFWRLSV